MEEEAEETQIEAIVKCSECGSRNLLSDEVRGETTCGDCGLVLAESAVDQGAEWRTFGPDDEGKARTGAPMSYRLHDKGLSTDIDWQNKDYCEKISRPSNL